MSEGRNCGGGGGRARSRCDVVVVCDNVHHVMIDRTERVVSRERHENVLVLTVVDGLVVDDQPPSGIYRERVELVDVLTTGRGELQSRGIVSATYLLRLWGVLTIAVRSSSEFCETAQP